MHSKIQPSAVTPGFLFILSVFAPGAAALDNDIAALEIALRERAYAVYKNNSVIVIPAGYTRTQAINYLAQKLSSSIFYQKFKPTSEFVGLNSVNDVPWVSNALPKQLAQMTDNERIMWMVSVTSQMVAHPPTYKSVAVYTRAATIGITSIRTSAISAYEMDSALGAVPWSPYMYGLDYVGLYCESWWDYFDSNSSIRQKTWAKQHGYKITYDTNGINGVLKYYLKIKSTTYRVLSPERYKVTLVFSPVQQSDKLEHFDTFPAGTKDLSFTVGMASVNIGTIGSPDNGYRYWDGAWRWTGHAAIIVPDYVVTPDPTAPDLGLVLPQAGNG
jgi:hypothetical protein